MLYNGDSNQLDMKEEIFSKLKTKTDIAATWAHEAIYKILREKNAHTSSKLTRRLVGCLFSDDNDCLRAVKASIPTDTFVYQCTGSVDLTIIPDIKFPNPDALWDWLEKAPFERKISFHSVVTKMNGIETNYPMEVKNKTLENAETPVIRKLKGTLSSYGYEYYINYSARTVGLFENFDFFLFGYGRPKQTYEDPMKLSAERLNCKVVLPAGAK